MNQLPDIAGTVFRKEEGFLAVKNLEPFLLLSHFEID